MIIVKHELRQGKNVFLIWSCAIGFLLAVCIFLFPDMKAEMDQISRLFSSMGAFTAAFGMDRLDFGALSGYYAIECGNVLGIGGAFFAALCAVGILSKEEKEHTAEFLLSHPVSRVRIITEKWISVAIRILLLNLMILILSVASIAAIGEAIPWQGVTLLHLAYTLLQLEIAGVCFGLSAFQRGSSLGAGLGIAALLYMLNLIANISDAAAFLKYITPFAYCDGAEIMIHGRLDALKISIGMALCVLGILAAYAHYPRKDIR